MNAQTVMDHQNKYRFGVLIGNENEERFGLDLVQKNTFEKTGISVMKQSYALQNTVYAMPEQREREKHLWKGAPLSKQAHGKFGLDSEIRRTNYEELMRRGENELKGNFKENGSYLEPQLISQKEKEEVDLVKFNQHGEQSHIFFGHGIKKDDFGKRDFKTTNELAYNLNTKPTTFFHSKFEPNQTKNVLTFKRDEIFDKNHLRNITFYGDMDKNPKKYKHYDEFTKKFDASYNPLNLRNLK